MKTAERRESILLTLSRNGHSTASALSNKYGVSERTILRDIEALSILHPIYTSQGRYNGGIYLPIGYRIDKLSLNNTEERLMNKIVKFVEKNIDYFSECEIYTLKKYVTTHSSNEITN